LISPVVTILVPDVLDFGVEPAEGRLGIKLEDVTKAFQRLVSAPGLESATHVLNRVANLNTKNCDW
jgi:hypothetical protein